MKRRRKMPSGFRSGYSIGTKKKSHKKILLRIGYTLAAAAVMISVAILLGLHMNRMADKAASRTENSESVDHLSSQETTDPYCDGVKSTSGSSSLKVTAADINVTGVSKENIDDIISDLSPEYNAVSIRITDGDRLVYLSPAMLNYSRLPEGAVYMPADQGSDNNDSQTGDESGDDTTEKEKQASDPLENIRTAISAAKKRGLRTSSVFSVSGSVLTNDEAVRLDCIIIGELASLGFDEVIIKGLANESADISAENVASIVSYLAKLRTVSGSMDLGITLPASVYLDAPTASSIKTISEYADILAIDVSSGTDSAEEAYKSVYDGCYSLKGNFSVYNIRGMITDLSPETAEAACAALKAIADASVQFSVFVENPSYTPNSPGSSDNATTDDPDANKNPNAMTSDKYSTDTSNTGNGAN